MRYFKIIYLLVIGVLLIPLIEQHIHCVKIAPLAGYFEPAVKPAFTKDAYIDLVYQEQAEKYVNENFGFRNTLIRFRNQIYFSCLNQSPIVDYTIGKNKYLFENSYIDAYYGNDFVGDTILDNLTSDIQTLQDTLAKHNVTLLTIIAPSKAWYFSEYLPASLDLTPFDPNTNYDVFQKFASSKKLNMMDFNASYLNQKKSTPFPLYTKNGTHWSFYGATLSFDSILRKMESLTGKQFPKMQYVYAEEENNPNCADNDVARTFNLLYNPENDGNALQPHVVFKSVNGRKPMVLGVTDSYYGIFYEMEYLQNCFRTPDYWFAYYKFFPVWKYANWQKEKSDLKRELEKHQVVILLCTPHNIDKIGWGFVEEAIQAYNTDSITKSKYNYKDILKFETKQLNFISDVKWFQGILEQAKEQKLDPEKHFDDYTRWFIKENDKKK